LVLAPPPTVPLLLPPTPVLLPVLPAPLPVEPIPEVLGLVVELLPVPDVLLLPVPLLLPLLLLRRQSSFAIPVSTSQRLVPELDEPLALGLLELGLLELELSVLLGLVADGLLLAPVLLLPLAPVLLLSLLLGLEVELLLLGLDVEPLLLGLEVELPLMLPPGLVWAMERLATPRNAAATAALITLVFICAPKGGLEEDCSSHASRCYARYPLGGRGRGECFFSMRVIEHAAGVFVA
jgi:hypothetical protein